MDTTQVKSDFNGFGPLPSPNAGRSVGFVGAFAPMDIPTTRLPPQKNLQRIECYSNEQQFYVDVNKYNSTSSLIIGDADGSPQIRLETDSVSGTSNIKAFGSSNATITSEIDPNNATYIDAGVVSIIAGGVSCNIDPGTLPNNAAFILVNIGGTNFYVLGCPA
jgi:hypothetical protein